MLLLLTFISSSHTLHIGYISLDGHDISKNISSLMIKNSSLNSDWILTLHSRYYKDCCYITDKLILEKGILKDFFLKFHALRDFGILSIAKFLFGDRQLYGRYSLCFEYSLLLV